MTNAQAATVAHDLITAGYQAIATSPDGIAWTVVASLSNGALILASAANSFATTHSVTAEASQFTLV